MDPSKLSWKPLPKRERRSKRNEVMDIEVTTNNNNNNNNNNSNSEENAKQVDENIRLRSKRKLAVAKLEDTDGVAGEFYEYLDHTADVQLHAWGNTLVQAFENIVPCMFNYATDLSKVEINPEETIEFTVSGHDMQSLLFKYLDEFLFRFCTDYFCCKKAQIIEFDREKFSIRLQAFGEIYDQLKHSQGTEIKAITYSYMQIHENENRSDLYVIVDI